MHNEIFVDEKPAYYSFDAAGEKLTGAQVMERYGIGQQGDAPGSG